MPGNIIPFLVDEMYFIDYIVIIEIHFVKGQMMKEIKKTEILTVRLTEEMKRNLTLMSNWEDRSAPGFLELVIRSLSENYVLLKRIQIDEEQRTGYHITFNQIIGRALKEFAEGHETNQTLNGEIETMVSFATRNSKEKKNDSLKSEK